MYINAVEETVSHTTQPSGSIRENSDENVIIGNSPDHGWTYVGLIDEVRIWNLPRTAQEIQGNMNVSLSGSEPGLVGYWQMNEGVGETIQDKSQQGYNGNFGNVLWREGVHVSPLITDTDEDGVIDVEDNCPDVYNPNQEDRDTDGRGDVCDNCPDYANSDQADADSDDTGDVCDLCTDSDGDGYGDPGYPANTCEEDNCPDVYNPDQGDIERGDINCDGNIDVLDVLATINHILGTTPLIGQQPLDRADCNSDDGVNILDALGIINVILGTGECLPSDRPLVSPDVVH